MMQALRAVDTEVPKYGTLRFRLSIDPKQELMDQPQLASLKDGKEFLVQLLEACPAELPTRLIDSKKWGVGPTPKERPAPRAIQFYKSDWAPYIFRPDGILATDNDKAIPEFAQLLSEVARVDVNYLTDFTPGTDNAREKLRWVRRRWRTWFIVLPASSARKTELFSRLQEELLKQSDDVSLFDWIEGGVAPVADGPIRGVVTGVSCLLRTNLDVYQRVLKGPPPGHALVNGRMSLTPHAYFAIKSVNKD
ncbi:hypothetical protein BDN67DRAFT_1003858 [Paxillus ammoniavirescens]|nr:hypothetical protein BDN67DRAFT_1003858 [Paxillus ammoniavirescens]